MGIITTPMYWSWRRSWHQAQAAAEREERLAHNYTPRERRESEMRYELDRTFRFTRDALLDMADIKGVTYKASDMKHHEGSIALLKRSGLSVKRYNELVRIVDGIKATKREYAKRRDIDLYWPLWLVAAIAIWVIFAA